MIVHRNLLRIFPSQDDSCEGQGRDWPVSSASSLWVVQISNVPGTPCRTRTTSDTAIKNHLKSMKIHDNPLKMRGKLQIERWVDFWDSGTFGLRYSLTLGVAKSTRKDGGSRSQSHPHRNQKMNRLRIDSQVQYPVMYVCWFLMVKTIEWDIQNILEPSLTTIKPPLNHH